MTPIHKAFSSEEWRERFHAKVAEHARLTDELLEMSGDGESKTVDFGLKVIRNDEIFSVVDFGKIEAFFAAELEKKEKEVEQIVAGFVPEERKYPDDDEDLAESEDIGWNACREEIKKKINRSNTLCPIQD
jgi:hypothetical protein